MPPTIAMIGMSSTANMLVFGVDAVAKKVITAATPAYGLSEHVLLDVSMK
jgi:hypothetical protein